MFKLMTPRPVIFNGRYFRVYPKARNTLGTKEKHRVNIYYLGSGRLLDDPYRNNMTARDKLTCGLEYLSYCKRD